MESHNIYDIVKDVGLGEKYTDDVSRLTIIYFQQKGITIHELLEYQKYYSIIYPWDIDYNSVRLNFNRVGQYYPKMIIMISRSKDILWIINFALKYNITFTIRGGGHDSHCYSLCNGIMIDTTKRNFIKFQDNNTIKVGAGVRLGPLVEKLGDKSLFIPHGTLIFYINIKFCIFLIKDIID